MHRSHATSVAASGVIHQYALRRPVLLQSGAGGRRRRLLSPWRSRPTCERFGDDPAVRRRDGPDRARDERSVAFAIAPRTPGPAIPFVGKHSSGRGARHSPCWAIPIVRCSADAARSGRPLRRHCDSPAHAGARTKAVAPCPARTHSDLGDRERRGGASRRASGALALPRTGVAVVAGAGARSQVDPSVCVVGETAAPAVATIRKLPESRWRRTVSGLAGHGRLAS
jgi:hypothetical protein